MRVIEVDQPTYDAENMRFIPVWETLSIRDHGTGVVRERL